MKLKTVLLLIACAGLVSLGWWLWPESAAESADDSGKVLRSRRIREGNAKGKSGRTSVRIAGESRSRPRAGAASDSFDINDSDKLPSGFIDDEEELMKETSTVVKKLYQELLASMSGFDRKKMRLSVSKLLAALAKGEQVPRFMKLKVLEALKMGGDGCGSLADLLLLAADSDPIVSSTSLDALQELLWDFDARPQQLAEAIRMATGLTTDKSILESFVFEMNDLPVKLKVDTALAIIDSGNDAAVAVLDENKSFVFDDFNGDINSREDIVKYGERNGVDSDGDVLGDGNAGGDASAEGAVQNQ